LIFQNLNPDISKKIEALAKKNHVLSLETGNKVSPTNNTGVLPAAVVMEIKWRLNGFPYPTM